MSESIITVIDELCKKFGIVVDWTSDNVVPYMFDLMGRAIKYEIATSVMAIVFTLVLTIVIGILYAHYNKLHKTVGTHEGTAFVFCLFFVMCVITFVAALILQVDTITKCIFIPEKIFIEMLNRYL